MSFQGPATGVCRWVTYNALDTVPCYGHAEISHLGANARQRRQTFYRIRDVPVPFVAKNLCSLLNVSVFVRLAALPKHLAGGNARLGLVVVKANRPDKLIEQLGIHCEYVVQV